MAAAAAPSSEMMPSVVVPVTGDSSDWEKAQGQLSVPKIAVSWEDVSFQVKIKDPATGKAENKTILAGVSGEAIPGELMVLMGPSGAGKSTLLDCISARNRNCTGTILVNGRGWSKGVAKYTGYVMQDDLFYTNLTVLEHLTFQAELRMGRSSSAALRAQRVRAIVSEMGLSKVVNTPIGGVHVKGLSGGQRKRLSFATELLTNPSLLFVDEPTSGLDSFMAETVTLAMRNLARSGRTVIATIHQPSSELFELFDRLYLLVDGRTVYNGAAADSIPYFASIGYQCPSFMNPTDYFMRQLAIVDDQPESRDRVRALVSAWEKATTVASAAAIAPSRRSRAKSLADVDFDGEAGREVGVGALTQLCVLCRRNWLRMVRDTIGFRARIGSTLFITTVIGLIFLQLDRDQKGVQDFTGAMFFMATNQLFGGANPEFISVPLEIPLVMREHNGGLYHCVTWYAAKNVSELPAQLLFPALFLVPCYFMVGFGLDARVFFSFLLVLVLLSSCATGLGYMVSCLARRVDVAPIMGLLFILPSLLFGGLFLNSDSTPAYFVWLQPLSPIKYGFHALMRAFWSSVGAIDCLAGQRCAAATGADVLESNSVRPGRLWVDCIALLALNLSFRLVGALVLWRRSARPAAKP